MHERGFPGFEEGIHPKVPEGYITLSSVPFNDQEEEQPGRSLLYGLDCEMVTTTEGKEVGRVCIVDSSCSVVIDILIKPTNPIIDYLTAYSGLTKEMLDGAASSLRDLHKIIKTKIPPNAVFVGHSLEYDLHALRLMHLRCIDTTILYPHTREGFKLSLKRLAAMYLNINMKRTEGHNPKEDAQAALLLTLKKINNGPSFAVPMTQYVSLAAALQKLQPKTDKQKKGRGEGNSFMQINAAKEGEGADFKKEKEGFFFLADSFKYSQKASFQDVYVKDGLSDDGAVVRVCKDFLKERNEAGEGNITSINETKQNNNNNNNNKTGFNHKNRPWGVCVLRSFQRLCSHALGAPPEELYLFSYRSSCLLAAETELKRRREGDRRQGLATCATSPGSETGEESNNNENSFEDLKIKKKGEEELLDDPAIRPCLREDGKGLTRDMNKLFPSVSHAHAMKVLGLLDRLLTDLASALQPQDVMVLMSPCGDAYRYFSLSAMQTALRDNPLEGEAKDSFASAVCTAEFEREVEKAQNVFEGPGKGGWCSFFVCHSD